MILEILRFKLSPGADESAFLQADKRVQTEFAYQQPGLIRRTTARRDDGSWVVVDLWQSEADADRCDAAWQDDRNAAEFMLHVDPTSVTTERFETLD